MWWLLGIAVTMWLIWKVRAIYRREKAKEAAASAAAAIPRAGRRNVPLEADPGPSIREVAGAPAFDVVTTYSMTSEPDDPWEGYFANDPDAVPFEGVFTFNYADLNGTVTRRTIEARKLIPLPDKTMLFGYCRLRLGNRHFNLSRVSDMSDGFGRRIRNPAVDLLAMFFQTELGRTLELFRLHDDALTALMFVSRSDGRLTRGERAAIGEFLNQLAPGVELRMDAIDERLSRWPTITQTQFSLAVRSLAGRPAAQRTAALTAARAVAAATKTPNPVRAAHIEDLERQLEAKEPRNL